MSLGTRIKECRLKAGLSQEKLAELLGISRQAVTKWESDQSAPNTENLFKLAQILGTTVDFLITSDQKPDSVAEQVFRMLKTEEAQKEAACRARRRSAIITATAIAGGYLVVFLLCKLFWSTREQMTVMGWLFGTGPLQHEYLFGWLIGKNLYLYCSLLSILPALFGKGRFSAVTFAGFTLGLPLGEYLGNLPQIVPPGYHYGWAIWGGIYLLSITMGIGLQRFKAEDLSLNCRKMKRWCIGFLLGIVGIIAFVLLNIPPAYN